MKVKPLKLSVTSDYLVETSRGYVLIDTGYEYDRSLFATRLREAGANLSEIGHLVLTHHHDDHCGLLNDLTQANQDLRVIMSRRAAELLAKGENDRTHGGAWVSAGARLFIALLRKTNQRVDRQWQTHSFPPYLPRETDILLKGDTDLAELGIGLRGRIIETPGHTTDSISVLLDDGSCFAGDAAANLPRLLGTKYCVLLLQDLDEYYRSWGKLIAAGARRIYPAHGGAFAAENLSRHMGAIRGSDLLVQA